MEILRGFEALERVNMPRTVATVGSYDGVHAAHRMLVERCIAEARRRQCASMVVTFEPHPRITLHRDEDLALLTTLEEKAYLLEQLGVDYLFVIDFDERFSHISQEAFLQDYLVAKLGVECLVMGYNHRFGHGAGGNSASISTSGMPIDVVSVEQLFVARQKVSSTVVRRTIASGNMTLAHQQLGHHYIIIGEVVGNRMPMTNRYKLLPAEGRYRADVEGLPCDVDIECGGLILPTDEYSNRKIVVKL